MQRSWISYAFLVLLLTFANAQYALPTTSYLAQFKVASRFGESHFEGWAFVDREKNNYVHAILVHEEDNLFYEYKTTMGSNVNMYHLDKRKECKKFSIPMPEPLYDIVSDLDRKMTEQQSLTVDGVFDANVKECVDNNTVTLLPLGTDDHLVLCGGQQLPSRMIAERFTVTLTSIVTDVNTAKALMDTTMGQLSSCEMLFEEEPRVRVRTVNTKPKNQVPWFVRYDKSCHLDPIRDHDHCTYFEQKTNKRRYDNDLINPRQTCVFLHGVGQTIQEKGPPLFGEWIDYWGYVHQYTPQCKERIFIREETKMRGWNDQDLQKSYCSVALMGSNSTDSVIRNTVLFVHSMGNLILAGAIKNGFCDLDRKTSSWYQIQGPFSGSKAALLLKDICMRSASGDWPVSKDKLYRYVAEEGGYCVPNTNHSYIGYQTLTPSWCSPYGDCIADLHDIANQRIKGSMCGNAPYGLFSRYGPALKLLSQVVGYGEESDGLVPLSSCKESGNNAKWTNDYRQLFYAADINHADGTCRNGNGYFSDDRQPCLFYTNKV